MMRVYIDTSVIINENYLHSSMAVSFLRAAKFLGIRIIIPEIVIDEAKGKYISAITKFYAQYKKAARELDAIATIDVEEIDISERSAEYGTWLDETLEKYEVIIIPYPDVSVKEIVVHSYKKTKPFKENGEGHKDYVIWSSICHDINNFHYDSDIFFLTNNTKDFCEKSGDDFALHSDLAKQIKTKSAAPKIFTNVKAFFDENVIPNLSDIDTTELPDINIEDVTGETLIDDLGSYSAYGFEGIPFSNEVYISMIGEADIDNISIKKIDEDEIMIIVEGMVEIEADGYIDKSTYVTSSDSDIKSIYVSDPDWNDHVMSVSATTQTPFILNFSYSKKDSEINDHSLVLPGEIEYDF